MNVTNEELDSITRAIYTRYGIDFTNYEPTSLKRRISRIIDRFQLENSLGLWRKLIYEREFIEVFINEVTVGLTEMFRNHDFWIKIREDILPQLSNQKDVSIWHAGCSTGEEVYSMAICLTEQDMIGKTSVIATDINSKFLQEAQQGTFSNLYKGQYTKNYEAAKGRVQLQNYYSESDESITFSKLNTRDFKFEAHNLTKDPVEDTYDIIFCRNVMIYFDETLKRKVLKNFYDSLPDDARKYFKPFDPGRKIYQKVS